MSEFYYLSIAYAEYVATYSATVTSEGSSETAPSYSHGGLPADGAEFEVKLENLREGMNDGSRGPDLEVPKWLRDQLEFKIQMDDTVIEQVFKDHRDQQKRDRDEAADSKRREMRDEPQIYSAGDED